MRNNDYKKLYDNEKLENKKIKEKLDYAIIERHQQLEKKEEDFKKIKEELEKKIKDLKTTLEIFKENGKLEEYKKEDYHVLEKKSYSGMINLNGLKSFKDGWKIYDFSGKNLLISQTHQSKKIIATVGPYGKGKTFFLSKLCDLPLPHGILYHTKGLSINFIDQMILIDSEGYQTPIGIKNPQQKDIKMKKLEEEFISRVIMNVSDIFLFVVQHLSCMENEMLLEIKKMIKQKKKDSKTQIFVIHNFSDVWNGNDVETLWKEEIQDIFIGEFKPETNSNPACFTESGNTVRHFCLFNEYSNLKEKNEKVYKFIKDCIYTNNNTLNEESFLHRIQKSLDNIIPDFFPTESIQNEQSKGEFKYVQFLDEKNITDSNIVKGEGFIGIIKPTVNIIKEKFEKFLEGYGGNSKSNLTIEFDEIIEGKNSDIYKIIFDTPGLDDDESEKLTISCSEQEMNHHIFKTKQNDVISIGILYLTTGMFEVHYTRIINKYENPKFTSRSEGTWKKKIDIPEEFKIFDEISIYIQSGQLIIKIPKSKINQKK